MNASLYPTNAAAPASALRLLERRASTPPQAAVAQPQRAWLQRLADWADAQPVHRRLGSGLPLR